HLRDAGPGIPSRQKVLLPGVVRLGVFQVTPRGKRCQNNQTAISMPLPALPEGALFWQKRPSPALWASISVPLAKPPILRCLYGSLHGQAEVSNGRGLSLAR